MKYKGIIFDLDGVLCSTDRFHFEAWKQTAEEVGAPFDETINMKLRGVSRMESLEIILSGSSKTFTDAEKERLATEKNDRYRKLLSNVEEGIVFSRRYARCRARRSDGAAQRGAEAGRWFVQQERGLHLGTARREPLL